LIYSVMEGNKMKYYETEIKDFRIRVAEETDVSLILDFIRELADYENLSNEVAASKDVLLDSLFVKHQAEVIIAEYKEKPVGFATYFFNFSTFLGKANLYIEDLYIKKEFRRFGLGKAIFSCLARIAEERNCERLDWSCLDWNEPSIKFYKKMGAKPVTDWTVFRVEGEALDNLSRMK